MSKLPDYVTEARYRLELKAAAAGYRTILPSDDPLFKARADLEAAIERYSQESVTADYRRRWQESYGKLIEENPDTLPPFIDNPPPIG